VAATTFIQIFAIGGQFAFAVVTDPDVSAGPFYASVEAATTAAIAANPGLEVRRPDGTLIQADAASNPLIQ
jgi:hypothetical protein